MLLASDGITISEKWTTVLPSKIDGDFFYSAEKVATIFKTLKVKNSNIIYI